MKRSISMILAATMLATPLAAQASARPEAMTGIRRAATAMPATGAQHAAGDRGKVFVIGIALAAFIGGLIIAITGDDDDDDNGLPASA